MTQPDTAPGSASATDPAGRALDDLVAAMDRCVEELERARARAESLRAQRRAGRPWLDIVSGEERPLVVESVSTVLSTLATAGHAWRREQASALQGELVSINRIAALFGVTRQRISALLRERDEGEASSP
ncbi:MAG: hypothetical protein JWQ45_1350 [Blastococcus sp.]|nr:hypothetical protein [Blastococcus sp.]